MKNKEVPMTYVTSKFSKDVIEIYEILYGIFGITACVLIYKILKLERNL